VHIWNKLICTYMLDCMWPDLCIFNENYYWIYMLYTMCLNCLKLLHVTEHTLDLCTCEKSWLFIHNLHCLVLFCIIGILIWWPCIKRSGCWFFSCYKHLQITYWQRRKQERWFVSPLPSLLNVSWQNWIEGALHHNTRTPTVKLVGKAAYANRKSVGD
jgi:hypothetical protein